MIQKYSIGRNPDNQIVLNYPMISGYHADIIIDTNGNRPQYTFTDHSRNGSWINGQLLHQNSCLIAYGDSITFPGNIGFDWSCIANSNFIIPHNDTCISTPAAAGQNNSGEFFPEDEKETITFTGAFKRFFTHYADFDTRSRRREYWFVTLWNVIISSAITCILSLMIAAAGVGIMIDDLSSIASAGGAILILIIYFIYEIAIIVPSLALTVRRIHDTGKSGWWILMSLIPLVGFVFVLIWSFSDSERVTNEWGPCPKRY